MRGRPTKDPHTRPAINTLERLHMELGGQILANRQQHDALAEQMRHVEAVIKMAGPQLQPGPDRGEAAEAKPVVQARHPLQTRAGRAQTATEPMTATELAKAVLAANGVQDATGDDVQGIALGIQHSLKNHEGKGVERVGEANPARWRVAL
ncbi:hypothetical protein JQ616_17820 [Bradyrhizobium tropiciagri]|uniref:hypothetical protein n=1 Tax=Bradyrhizobium tropiciagri TaxID=312253 RepID=UPI001BABCFA9|nr:hypothetical protein [Bradyrhizobium tropiciagri]MBR0896821.1 hypothetical protein [Bradyrhizobium tropiciagri]